MKIVLLDAYAANPGDLSWDGLREFGEVTVYDRTAPKDVLARIGDAEVVYVNKVRLDEQTLRQCENLKLVSVLATGYNVVDTAAAKELGILVCNSPSYSTASVAQLTIAHLLELCSHVGVLSAYLVYLGYDLISKTIKDEEGGSFWYIIVGVVFAVVGVYVLIDCWKCKRQHDAEEREAQRQELQAKGLLDFDEPADEADTEPADDDFWTENSDAEATPDGDASSDETDA